MHNLQLYIRKSNSPRNVLKYEFCNVRCDNTDLLLGFGKLLHTPSCTPTPAGIMFSTERTVSLLPFFQNEPESLDGRQCVKSTFTSISIQSSLQRFVYEISVKIVLMR